MNVSQCRPQETRGPIAILVAGPYKLLCRAIKGLAFWYINVSCKIIIKSVRELCVVSHCVFLKITNARIPHERGARLRQIGPIGLRPALPSAMLQFANATALPSVPQKWYIGMQISIEKAPVWNSETNRSAGEVYRHRLAISSTVHTHTHTHKVQRDRMTQL